MIIGVTTNMTIFATKWESDPWSFGAQEYRSTPILYVYKCVYVYIYIYLQVCVQNCYCLLSRLLKHLQRVISATQKVCGRDAFQSSNTCVGIEHCYPGKQDALTPHDDCAQQPPPPRNHLSLAGKSPSTPAWPHGETRTLVTCWIIPKGYPAHEKEDEVKVTLETESKSP